MKIAVTGKGGVGKTTLTVLLGRAAVAGGYAVFLIDADPDANLATTLGIEEKIPPLLGFRDVIAERTGGEGGLVKLNPRVDDIPDHYSLLKEGMRIMVLGTVRQGGSGCACPQNSFLRSLLIHLLLEREELVIVDMEAGIEHLGRGTAQGVDALLVLVDTDRRSMETAGRIVQLAREVGVSRVLAVANKVRSASQLERLKKELPASVPLLGYLGFDENLELSDKQGFPQPESNLIQQVKEIFSSLIKEIHSGGRNA